MQFPLWIISSKKEDELLIVRNAYLQHTQSIIKLLFYK